MSEFKFACPICGQHITADSGLSGSELDCPTCFRRIVVPQSSGESKFVLSASEVNVRRRSGPIPTSATVSRPRKGKLRIFPILAGVIAGVLVFAGISFLLLKTKSNPVETGSSSTAESSTVRRSMPSGTVAWTLELRESEFPAETAFGRLQERDFVCDRAVLQGGTLNLRMEREWPPQLGLSVVLYAHKAEDLAGKSAVVNTNNIRSPRIVVRWKEAGENRTSAFTNGYAMRLEFGALKGNRLPGKIYLCLPDGSRSAVAGVFNAEVRQSALRTQFGTNSSN